MTRIYLSAAYANPDSSAAVAVTAEAGAVALSIADTPVEWDALHAALMPEPYMAPEPAQRFVPTILIVERLGAAGLLHAAYAALMLDAPAASLTAAQLLLRERFRAASAIPADDADVRAVLTAIGADPDAILAP